MTNPSIEGLSVTEATEKLTEIGLEPIVIGNGSKVESQIPAKDETLLIGEKVMIKTEGELIAPDMTGWSLTGCHESGEGSEYEIKQCRKWICR